MQSSITCAILSYNISGTHFFTIGCSDRKNPLMKKQMKKCKVLKDYSIFVAMVRENSCNADIKDAIIKAVDDCIRMGILKDFLLENRKEVEELFWDEMDEEIIQEIMREDYIELGIEQGREEERVNTERERMRAERAEEELKRLRARLVTMGITE